MKNRDDYRAEISQRLTTGALALLAIWAGSVGVVLQFRVAGTGYWLLAVLTGLMLVASPVLGGLGVSRLSRGIEGRFSAFNLQLVTCLVGFLLFIASASVLWWGEPSEERVASELEQLSATLSVHEATIDALRIELAAYDSIHREQIAELRQHIQDMAP